MMELNNIYQGDCRKLLKLLDDECIDLVCSDVAYPVQARGGRSNMSLEQFRSDITRQAKGLLNSKASFQVKMSLAYGLIEEHFDIQIEFYF